MGRHCKCRNFTTLTILWIKYFGAVKNEDCKWKLSIRNSTFYNNCSFLAVHKKNKENLQIIDELHPLLHDFSRKLKFHFVFLQKLKTRKMWHKCGKWFIPHCESENIPDSAAAKDGCGFTEVILSQFCWTGELYCNIAYYI